MFACKDRFCIALISESICKQSYLQKMVSYCGVRKKQLLTRMSMFKISTEGIVNVFTFDANQAVCNELLVFIIMHII